MEKQRSGEVVSSSSFRMRKWLTQDLNQQESELLRVTNWEPLWEF